MNKESDLSFTMYAVLKLAYTRGFTFSPDPLVAWKKACNCSKGPVSQINVTLFRLKYRVFMIMARSLLQAYFIILKLEEIITKSDKSKEI